MYTPPSRLRVENPSPAMVAYREKYNHPAAARQMICSDIRIPFNHPHKVFVRAWNQLVSKKTQYLPILQRTIETTDHALTRLRAKEMIGLLDSVRRMDGFDYSLMLRTLDFIEVHSKEKMTVVFQSDIRISVVENWATLLIFGSVEGAISKSVAQFIALIFAYIMP